MCWEDGLAEQSSQQAALITVHPCYSTSRAGYRRLPFIAHRMGRLYSFLGLSVGVVQEHHSKKRRQAAFEADITYVTSNALGFTYLLDTSTAMSPDELVNILWSPMHCALEKGGVPGGSSPHRGANPSGMATHALRRLLQR